MDKLKKFFPLSYKFKDDVTKFIIGLLIYLTINVVGAIILSIITFVGVFVTWMTVILIPVGILFAIVMIIIAALFGIYIWAGIIILILMFAKVIKDEPVIEEAVAEEIAE